MASYPGGDDLLSAEVDADASASTPATSF